MFWPESFWADAETVPLKVSDNLSLTVDSDDDAALNLMDLRAAAFFASDTGLALRLQLITGSVLTLRGTLGSILGPVVL